MGDRFIEEYMSNPCHQGKIYKITSNKTKLVYIGSTTQTLESRLNGHYNTIKNNVNTISNNIIKYKDHRIELIEDYPCTTKAELRARAQYWINITPCINIATSSAKVYYKNEENLKKDIEYRNDMTQKMKAHLQCEADKLFDIIPKFGE